MASIFTKIVNGDIPAYKIAETEKFLAFLDVFPLAKGHVLVIPKMETDYIFDMETEEYIELWAFAKQIAKAIGKAIPCKRVGVAVIGLEVPHAHIHLIPLKTVEDINFSKPKLKLESSVFEEIADNIKAKL
jgi:histidine triad (HIT) family protein